MSDRLRDAIYEAGHRYVSPNTLVLDEIYDAVVALAKSEASVHDSALEALKHQLELAWRTIQRLFPKAVFGSRTLAGAIMGLSSMFTDLATELADETARADLAEEHLRDRTADVVRLDAMLQARDREAEKPGFQTILRAIKARAQAAHDQFDLVTEQRLYLLCDAAEALLLQGRDAPTVNITFSYWPIQPQGADLRAMRPKPIEPMDPFQETTFEFVMSPWPTTIEANAKVKLTLVGGAFKSIDQRFQQPDGSYPR
jgi:hypothetical protein